MDSRTGEIGNFKDEAEAKAAGHDIQLTPEQADALRKLAADMRLAEYLWSKVADRYTLPKFAGYWFKRGVCAARDVLVGDE